jgi:CubicO group peptidase (beta-lactamase class C family)
MNRDFGELEAFIIETMRKDKIPGLSIAVVDSDQVIYSRGYGFSDIASGTRATPRTLCGIGSVTKSFTALAVMQLVEEGKIRLDDAVEKHLPMKLRPFGVPVTVHHLLSHSSGIPDLGYADAFLSGVLGYDNSWLPVSSAEDVIAFMNEANEWAVNKPGERFFYLNEGYVLLGLLISKLSGLNYEEYVRERILRPLRMDRTFFGKADIEKDGDRATAYILDKEGRHIQSVFPYGISSDGGLVSNVLDLSNYLRMCLDRGEFEGKTLVTEKTFASMEKPHILQPSGMFGREAYGYGWGVAPDFFGHKLVAHSGSVGVYSAYAAYLPDRKIGVGVLANSGGLESNIGLYALSLLIGEDPRRLPLVKTERMLNRLAGQYEAYKGTIKITIRKAGSILYYEYKNKYEEETIPLIPDKLEEDQATFYATIDGKRNTLEFRIRDAAIELIGDRVKLVKKI